MGILRKKKAKPAVGVVEEVETETEEVDLTQPQVAEEPKKSFDERTGKLPWEE